MPRMSAAQFDAHQKWKDREVRKLEAVPPIPAPRPADAAPANRTLRLRLPWPPSVNHYYITKPSGGKVLTDTARQFRSDVAAIVYREMLAAEVEQFIGPVSLQITLAPPDKRRRDGDNGLKAIFDSLQHAGVVANDEQIKHFEVHVLEPMIPGEGACHVVVRAFA